MHRHAALSLLLLSLTLAACNAGAPPTSPTASPAPTTTPSTNTPPPSGTPVPPGDPQAVDGRDFVSVRVRVGDPDRALVPGTVIHLGFLGGHITANAGCNTMGATYAINGDVMTIGQAGVTEIGCQADLQTQDEWLFAFLGSQPHLALSGNDLQLTSGATTINMLDREVATPDQPLTGRVWTLNSIISTDVVSSVPAGATATLSFTDDGRVDIQDGCNSGGGHFTVAEGTIQFSDIVSTQMLCSGAAGEVAAAVTAVLAAGQVTYQIDAANLTIMAGGNGLQFTA